jgi:hypothetical protein
VGFFDCNLINTECEAGDFFSVSHSEISEEDYRESLRRLWNSPYRSTLLAYAWAFERNNGSTIVIGPHNIVVKDLLASISKKYPAPGHVFITGNDTKPKFKTKQKKRGKK